MPCDLSVAAVSAREDAGTDAAKPPHVVELSSSEDDVPGLLHVSAGESSGSRRLYDAAKFSGGESSADERRKYQRDSLRSRNNPGQPGSRRFQRFQNGLDLTAESETEAEELEEELKIETTSLFSNLHEDKDLMRLWEPFLDITEEEQEVQLEKIRARRVHPRRLPRHKQRRRRGTQATSPCDVFYRRVHRRIRAMLKSQADLGFIRYIEIEVVKTLFPDSVQGVYGVDAEELNTPAEEEYQDDWVVLETYDDVLNAKKQAVLQVELPSSYHRLLFHGVCQFYGLTSHSEDQPGGPRKSVATKVKPFKKPMPPSTLYEFLSMQKAH